MILIFDTETTGLAPYAQRGKGLEHPKNIEAWRDCRVVQIAWMICDSCGGVKKERDYIIKPKYFMIPDEAAKIHGITQQKAKAEGVALVTVLEELLADLKTCDLLVAHNIQFDLGVVLSEIYRAGLEGDVLEKIPKYCTMLAGCKENEKWPKLSELYVRYFNKLPEVELHRALNDVELCRAIFFYQSL